MDNLDLILDAIAADAHWSLRKQLQHRNGPIMIGAATHPLSQSAHRDAAFYEFFQPHHLEPLDERETERCMRALAHARGAQGQPVLQVLNTQPERLKTLHALTGGNPRVLTLIYRLLEAAESDEAMADLDILLDQVTPYYKARIEEYQTAQQRAVIDAIALNWDPITAADIARLTNIAATTLPNLLAKLRKDGLIELTELSGASAGHQIAERFFNIWYLMRHGTRRTKHKMRWLVGFLSIFYSARDLADIDERVTALAGLKQCHPDYAYAVKEARRLSAAEPNRREVMEALTMGEGEGAELAADDWLQAGHIIAMVGFAKALQLVERDEYSAAFEAFDDIVARLKDAVEPALRRWAATALLYKAFILRKTGDSAASIDAYKNCIALNEEIEKFDLSYREAALARISLADLLIDSCNDLASAEALCQAAETADPTGCNYYRAWVYLLNDKLADARSRRDSLVDVPPYDCALLDAALELAQDNFGLAIGHLGAVLSGEPKVGTLDFGDDLYRLIRFAERQGYGERLVGWLEESGLADRLAPLYAAVKAYVRGEHVLLDINPETRGPARIIYDRLAAPRRDQQQAATPVGKAPRRRGRPRKA